MQSVYTQYPEGILRSQAGTGWLLHHRRGHRLHV